MPSLSMQESHRAAKDEHPREPARWATSEGEGGGSAVRKEGWGWGVFFQRGLVGVWVVFQGVRVSETERQKERKGEMEGEEREKRDIERGERREEREERERDRREQKERGERERDRGGKNGRGGGGR